VCAQKKRRSGMGCRPSTGRGIARGMARSEVAPSVVTVVECPGLARRDEGVAAGTQHSAGGYLRFPLFPEAVVGGAVAALLTGAAPLVLLGCAWQAAGRVAYEGAAVEAGPSEFHVTTSGCWST